MGVSLLSTTLRRRKSGKGATKLAHPRPRGPTALSYRRCGLGQRLRPLVRSKGSTMLKEFRDFAARGNVIDLAVGVIIGAAFGKVVTSVVNDLIMPPIGMALGRVDFSNLFVALDGGTYASLAQAKAATPPAPTLNYGHLPEYLSRVPDRRLCRVSSRQAGQPAQGPAPVVIDTRDCPFCLTKMPLKATRCPACTSEVKPAASHESHGSDHKQSTAESHSPPLSFPSPLRS